MLNLANQDVVSARMGSEGVLMFEKVVRRGGHSTYRTFCADQQAFDHWSKLEELECSYESTGEGLYAVDMPAAVDVAKAYLVLESGLLLGIWDFEEGYYFNS